MTVRGAVRRCARVAAWSATAAALLAWPFAYRFSSFGIDRERADGARVRCDFWRVRWPGDGSVALCLETTWRDGGDITAWDLGGRFLWPPRDLAPCDRMQRAGFWWVDHTGPAGAAPPIVAGAERAFLVAVPHWLVALATATCALATTFVLGRPSGPARMPAR